MDRKLLNKYFNDQCSPKELEQVLDWFQTAEGRRFLEEDIRQESLHFDQKNKRFVLPSEIESEKIYSRIQQNKDKAIKRQPESHLTQGRWYMARVASIILIVAAFSLGLFFSGVLTPKENHESKFITYATAPGQQKTVKLSDRVKIWLNESSVLKVPVHFTRNREVILKGEAYFEVVHNAQHPFTVKANGAVIKDLGTKFNVETDSAAGIVQVAVIEGKVELRKEGKTYKTDVILTHDHFGMLDLSSGKITIEKGNTSNYLSWMTNRLEFHGAPLGQISRQLQRIYHVKIHFQSNKLKRIRLTASFKRTKLNTVLRLIAHTLGIHFKVSKRRVIWLK